MEVYVMTKIVQDGWYKKASLLLRCYTDWCVKIVAVAAIKFFLGKVNEVAVDDSSIVNFISVSEMAT